MNNEKWDDSPNKLWKWERMRSEGGKNESESECGSKSGSATAPSLFV